MFALRSFRPGLPPGRGGPQVWRTDDESLVARGRSDSSWLSERKIYKR